MKHNQWIPIAGILLLASVVGAQTPARKAPPRRAPAKAAKAQTPAQPVARQAPASSAEFQTLSKDRRAGEVKKVQKTYKKFRDAAREYLGEVRALVRKRYRERRNLIAGGFEARIRILEGKEALKRKSAIAYFKGFVRKYPQNPRYSPDAMYRLAELIYEKEYEDYLARAGRYEEDLKKFENKEITDEPTPAKKQFSETNAWLTRLTSQFPKYRLLANAYYLLGYCRGEEENTQDAIKYFAMIPKLKTLKDQQPQAYASLKIPRSLLAEAWVRLGEFHFRANNRQKAKEAYLKVLAFPKLKIFDKALYKLAWTHYLLDEFQPAIDRFTQLLEFYITKKTKRSAAVLRTESIEYIAISFADERWGSLDKAVQYVRKVGLKKPYAREVLLQLSKNYGVQGKWPQVIAANEKVLELFPYHPENPLVQQQTILAWRRLGNLNKAMLARATLSKKFGPGTEWARKNEKNIRAQRAVQKIISNNIYRTALYNHTRCDTLRKEAEKDKENRAKFLEAAKASCAIAADNYKAFLQKFPHHKEAYKLTWYLADSLYFVKRYREATVYFKKIRDWAGEKEYRQEAAFSLVDSYVQLVNQDCRAKKVRLACELPEIKKKEQQASDNKKKSKKKKRSTIRRKKDIKAIPISNEYQKELVAAREFYLKKYKDSSDKRVPEQMYLLARIYYKYDQLENARKILWSYIKGYRKHKYRKYACETIVATHYREGNDDEMLEAMDQLRSQGCGVKDAGLIRLGVAFRKAERLEKAGKYEEAADAYVQIINKNPKMKKAAEGLWNAAYLYTRAQRFGSAIRLYERIVRVYPKWKKADKALFNVAFNAEKYFLFEKALNRYSKLANDPNFAKSKHRADALYNAALLMENLQRYDQAGRAYVRYSNRFSERKDAPEMLYKAAMIYKRTNRPSDMIRILKQFIRRYERDDKHVGRAMLAHGLIMEHNSKQGLSPRQQKREYENIIKVFSRLSSRMKPTDIALTRRFPAKASYMLAMEDYNRFLAMGITSNKPKRQVKQRNAKIKAYDEVSRRFSDLAAYKSAPWLLCAMFRIAEGKQKIAETFQKAPLPKIRGLKWTEEAKDMFKQNIDEKLVQPLEKQAIALYKKAVTRSKKLNYENECTYKAYEALHRSDPNIPLPKKDKPQFQFTPTSPLPLLKTLKKKTKKVKSPMKAPAPRKIAIPKKAPTVRKAPIPAPRPKPVTAPKPRQ